MTAPDGTHNFRDTGGVALHGGGATRSGVLLRSDALSTLTAAGLRALDATGVQVVVDLRSELERDAAPDLLPETRDVRVVELPLLHGSLAGLARDALTALQEGYDPEAAAAGIRSALALIPSLSDLYVSMLEHGAAEFAEIARLVATDPPVLVHCTAGKDRTGIAVALLLLAAGADRAAVVADYAASEDLLAGVWADRMRATIARMGVPLTPELDELATRTPPAALEQALDWVEHTHGGAAGYLRFGGASDEVLAGLHDRLAG